MARLIIPILLIWTLAHADGGERWDRGTMALQIAGAIGGVAAGSVVGGIIGGEGNRGIRGTAVGIALGAIVGGVVGEIYGVDQVGEWRGATGHWYGTTLGLLGGAGVALALHELGVPRTVQIVLATPLVIAGSILGYQLSTGQPARAIAIPLIGFAF
jgi:hypothetical protein